MFYCMRLCRLATRMSTTVGPRRTAPQDIVLYMVFSTLDVEPDGLTYIADSAVAEEITKVSEYKGTRIRMDARIDHVRLRIQIDFGVGDIMVPGPRMIEYSVFLD